MGLKPEFIMTVGLPASGKTAWAEQLKDKGFHVHSSDKIRAELLGDENAQTDNQLVFNELHKRVKEDLSAGIPCIYDATNMSMKRRKAFLDELKNIPCRKNCVIFPVPIEECKARNRSRERQVPDEVYDKMLRSFWVPYFYEGWDHIGVANVSQEVPSLEYAAMQDFSQDNPHHTKKLFAHLSEATWFAIQNHFSDEVFEAASYHDIGKLYTKSFKDAKGRDTQIAHFYGHECYGAYLYLSTDLARYCTESALLKTLYASALINWHMKPLTAWKQSPKSRDRDRKLIGERMYNDIMLLHAADLAAM